MNKLKSRKARKEDIPTVLRDEDFAELRKMLKEWHGAKGEKKEAYRRAILLVADDLERYYERGLFLPISPKVKKGLKTRLKEIDKIRDEVERNMEV